MARHSKEWNEGYQAAIEAIKKIMQGDNSDVSDNNSGGNGLSMPSEVFDKAQKEGGQKQTGNGKDKSINPDGQQQQDKQNGQQQGQGSGGSSSSGNGQQQQHSEDYKKGWAQAMEDYKKGKLKI